MATADSVKAKIQGLIDSSNETTGQNDTDLTSAVNHLKEGYGQGGGDQSGTAIWDAILDNGERTDFICAFANTSFTKETFKPSHDIKPTTADRMFYFSAKSKEKLFKMSDVEKECEMVFDFSNCTNFSSAFDSCFFSELNVIDVSKATNTNYAFYGGRSPASVQKINRLICSEQTNFSSLTFGYNDSLVDIGFEGTIAKNINLQWGRKLSKESILSLINALSATTSGLTVTLSKAAVDKIHADLNVTTWFPALAETRPNWTITLV